MALVKSIDMLVDQERKKLESKPPPRPKGAQARRPKRLSALARARARRKQATDDGDTTKLFRTAFQTLEKSATEAVERVSKTAQDLVSEAEGLRESLGPGTIKE